MDKEKVRAIMERVAPLTVLYGSQIWGVRANDSRVKRHLGAAERKFLLASVRCYRTVATETLRVVNGTPQWHLASAAAARFREELVRESERIGRRRTTGLFQGGRLGRRQRRRRRGKRSSGSMPECTRGRREWVSGANGERRKVSGRGQKGIA